MRWKTSPSRIGLLRGRRPPCHLAYTMRVPGKAISADCILPALLAVTLSCYAERPEADRLPGADNQGGAQAARSGELGEEKRQAASVPPPSAAATDPQVLERVLSGAYRSDFSRVYGRVPRNAWKFFYIQWRAAAISQAAAAGDSNVVARLHRFLHGTDEVQLSRSEQVERALAVLAVVPDGYTFLVPFPKDALPPVERIVRTKRETKDLLTLEVTVRMRPSAIVHDIAFQHFRIGESDCWLPVSFSTSEQLE